MPWSAGGPPSLRALRPASRVVLGVIMLSRWVLKCLYEVIALPITYVIVGWLKRAEGIDTFDRDVTYTVLPTAINA